MCWILPVLRHALHLWCFSIVQTFGNKLLIYLFCVKGGLSYGFRYNIYRYRFNEQTWRFLQECCFRFDERYFHGPAVCAYYRWRDHCYFHRIQDLQEVQQVNRGTRFRSPLCLNAGAAFLLLIYNKSVIFATGAL